MSRHKEDGGRGKHREGPGLHEGKHTENGLEGFSMDGLNVPGGPLERSEERSRGIGEGSSRVYHLFEIWSDWLRVWVRVALIGLGLD